MIRDAIKQRTNQNVEFFFPNAPFLPTGFDEDSFTWGLGDYRVSRVPGLDKSVAFLLSYLEEHGPFDGIIGSSAGCCVAVALASLLENPDRCAEFSVKVCMQAPLDQGGTDHSRPRILAFGSSSRIAAA